ncbi:hypothetical protein EBQ93_01795, partial [bacterium]|nr:hypothetical protein [bacterium]
MEEISDNEADFPAILETAEALGVGPCDIDEGDVEAYLDMGRELKGEINSSLGKILYWYNIALKVFILTTIFDDGNPANYPVSVDELKSIKASESFGEYFNKNIRSNNLYSDKPGACGC